MKKVTKPKVQKIDIHGPQKRRRPVMPTLLLILVLFGFGYLLWMEPLGLWARSAVEDVTRPVTQLIQNLLRVD